MSSSVTIDLIMNQVNFQGNFVWKMFHRLRYSKKSENRYYSLQRETATVWPWFVTSGLVVKCGGTLLFINFVCQRLTFYTNPIFFTSRRLKSYKSFLWCGRYFVKKSTQINFYCSVSEIGRQQKFWGGAPPPPFPR